jgi:hypothetical protein
MSIDYSPDGGISWITLPHGIKVRSNQVDVRDGTPLVLQYEIDELGVTCTLHGLDGDTSTYRPSDDITKTLLENLE